MTEDVGTSISRRLFHVIKVEEARPEDFRSMLANNRLPRLHNGPDASTLRMAAGVSCYATVGQALQQATRFRKLGRFIAELEISLGDGCFVEIARTGPAEGHHTVWASPEYLASRVVTVQSIDVLGS